MFVFKPVQNEAFIKHYTAIADDILKNNFHIDTHCSARMVERGIGIKEVKNVIREGQFSLVPNRFRREGYFYASYHHSNIFVVVCREWGNWYAVPKLVTVFEDGKDYEPSLEEMTPTPTVVEVEKVITKEVVQRVPLDEMSDEEFEAYARSRDQARRSKIQSELDAVEQQIRALEARRGQLSGTLNGASTRQST